MPARKEKAPWACSEAQSAADALERAISDANVARENLVQGLKRRGTHTRRLKLAAALGRALRGENGGQR